MCVVSTYNRQFSKALILNCIFGHFVTSGLSPKTPFVLIYLIKTMENTKDNTFTDIKLNFYTNKVIPKELKTGQVEEKKKKWQV